jgi:hypothetical protein
MKRANGIPTQLSSCHTAFVGGYVVEGHVPASDVKRLLAQRPAVSGLAVPGMPRRLRAGGAGNAGRLARNGGTEPRALSGPRLRPRGSDRGVLIPRTLIDRNRDNSR